MTINLQDKNLIVAYLQIFLRERLGEVVNKVVPLRKSEEPYYEITSRYPIEVTGVYDVKTFSALALFMFYNYPNEGYPYTWTETSEGEWSYEDTIYDARQSDHEKEERILSVIADNIEKSSLNKGVLFIPERVLSYVLGEVVSPISSFDEVSRVKGMLSDLGIEVNQKTLSYDSQILENIARIQKNFIESHRVGQSDETLEDFTSLPYRYKDIELPKPFEDFKVTGYIDPWTELLIKGRYT